LLIEENFYIINENINTYQKRGIDMNFKVQDLLKTEKFKLAAGQDGLDKEITGVYTGDLLSWVMAKAKEGDAWITIQGHVNIVAVSLLTEVSCILVAESAEISADTIEKANNENIPILTTGMPVYETAVFLSKLL